MGIKTPFSTNKLQSAVGHIATASTGNNGTTYTDVVNITGKGFLLGVSMIADDEPANTVGYTKIVVDGTTLYDGKSFVAYHDADEESMHGHVFSGPIKFDASLQVQHKTGGSNGRSLTTQVSYSLN